jgi:hypothetical protein
VDGTSISVIASLYLVSDQALPRHRDAHIPLALAQARTAELAASGDDLLAHLNALSEDARRLQYKAEAAGDYRTALAGIRELVRIVEVMAELRGELDRRPINLFLSAEWMALRTALFTALAPYPEARAAIARTLSVIDVEPAAIA